MHIYIPSLNRVKKQSTLQELPEQWLQKTTLVVPKHQYTEYLYVYGNIVKVLACPVTGIGVTRQWIMDTCPVKYLCMLNDDLRFFYYSTTSQNASKLQRSSKKQVGDMLEQLHLWLTKENIAHCGVRRRNVQMETEASFIQACRMNDVYAYNVKAFTFSRARFDRLPVMEDFDVTLTMLRAGFINRVSMHYAWDQNATNSSGGCSVYRTNAMQHEAAALLAKLHTGFVTIKKKKAWRGLEDPFRFDVTINWQAAYESYLATKRKPSKGLFKKGVCA